MTRSCGDFNGKAILLEACIGLFVILRGISSFMVAFTVYGIGKEARRYLLPIGDDRVRGRQHPNTLVHIAQTRRKDFRMAASDQVSTLTDRAKQAQDHVAAATTKGKADLETQSQAARQSAEKQAAALKSDTANAKSETSSKLAEVHAKWNSHVADIHQKADQKKADRDAKHAEQDAEDAEDYAQYAVQFAYAAIEEAESAVIDARLARVEADETVAAT